jgi:RNA polymerase sigma factor (sigma-70 family)
VGVTPLTAEQRKMVEDHLHVARFAARAYCRRRLREDDPVCDDVLISAAIGLMQAAQTFDPARGNLFATYARRRCAGQIIDDMRGYQPSGLKRGHVERSMATQRARDDFFKQHGRPPADAELRAMLGRPGTTTPRQFGLDVETGGAELDHVAVVDGDDAFDAMIGKLNTPLYRKVMAMHYRDGMTCEDIASSLGYSNGRIWQVRREALNALRAAVAR